jgi:hypothetical protein
MKVTGKILGSERLKEDGQALKVRALLCPHVRRALTGEPGGPVRPVRDVRGEDVTGHGPLCRALPMHICQLR